MSETELDGYIMPTGKMCSIRQEKLPQDARNIIAYIFALQLPVNEMLPIPTSAVEVKIEDAVNNILYGNGGFHRHGGSDSLSYFKHHQDDEWAVVFANDCDGDVMAAIAFIDALEAERNEGDGLEK